MGQLHIDIYVDGCMTNNNRMRTTCCRLLLICVLCWIYSTKGFVVEDFPLKFFVRKGTADNNISPNWSKIHQNNMYLVRRAELPAGEFQWKKKRGYLTNKDNDIDSYRFYNWLLRE